MNLRTEIVSTLRIHGPLDDDQLAARLGRNRHYVNQVCRSLSEHGLARRYVGNNDKLVTELVGPSEVGTRADGDEDPAGPSSRPKRIPRQERARRNADALIERFGACVARFESSAAFSGPSIYFHERAIAHRRRAATVDELLEDHRFFEHVYAVLPAWGMHRMGPQAAKVGPFDDMVHSFKAQRKLLAELYDLRICEVTSSRSSGLAASVWQAVAALKVSTSATRVVAGTKALHHVLPDLVPPIDRQYTFRFLTGQKAVAAEEPAFIEWFPILCEIASRSAVPIAQAIERAGPMATGEAKVLDNAIMGFMQEQG